MKHLYPTGTLTNTLQWVNKKSQECCGYLAERPCRHRRTKGERLRETRRQGDAQPHEQRVGKTIPGQESHQQRHRSIKSDGTRGPPAAPRRWGVVKTGEATRAEGTTAAGLITLLRHLDLILKRWAVSLANHTLTPSNTPCVSRHILPWTN